jgi:hypothetical protein
MIELTLQNFQGFATKQVIPLAPITLVFGPNSAGKSSVIRALLLIAQSMSITNDGFSFDGNLVDLGSFENTVYKHDVSKTITLGLKLSSRRGNAPLQILGIDWQIGLDGEIKSLKLHGEYLEDPEEDYWADFKVDFTPRQVTETPESSERFASLFSGEDSSVRFFLTQTSIARLRRMNKAIEKNDTFVEKSWGSKNARAPKKINREELRSKVKTALAEELSNLENQGTSLRLLTPSLPSYYWARIREEDDVARIPSRPMYGSFASSLDNFAMRIRSEFLAVDHLGPLRVVPGKLTTVSLKNQNRTNDGDSLASILGNSPEIRSRVSELLYRATDKNFRLEWAEIKAESKRAYLGKIGTLLVEDVRSGSLLSFKDVGTGISQILPLLENIARAMKLNLNKDPKTQVKRFSRLGIENRVLLLAEQPELHLHPRMQSFVGSLLSELVQADSARASQVIAETHSEAIILRLQREIKSGKLDATDLSVIYVDRRAGSKQNAVTAIPVDEMGNFLADWPESFSDVRLRELLGK